VILRQPGAFLPITKSVDGSQALKQAQRVASKDNNDELTVYMHPVEYAQLLATLHTLAPRRCLEWGSGGSTKAILRDCPFIERYVSIEHHGAWYQKVAQIVSDPRLSLNHIPANEPIALDEPSTAQIIAWDASAEQNASVMASYVSFAAKLDEAPFDFVLVDGRARRFCIAAGYELLRGGGVLVLHDAQREQYHDAVHATGGAVRFLEPWEQGQICLIRKPSV